MDGLVEVHDLLHSHKCGCMPVTFSNFRLSHMDGEVHDLKQTEY